MSSLTAIEPTEKRNARGQRGAAMVEFLLVMPILLAIVFATFTGAITYNNKLDLTQAAREGSRYGATIPLTQCNAGCGPSGTLNWAELVQSVVVSRSNGALTTSQVCVALVTGSPAGVYQSNTSYRTNSDGSTCFTDTGNDTSTRVQVKVQRSSTQDAINAVFFRIGVTLQSKSTARFEEQ